MPNVCQGWPRCTYIQGSPPQQMFFLGFHVMFRHCDQDYHDMMRQGHFKCAASLSLLAFSQYHFCIDETFCLGLLPHYDSREFFAVVTRSVDVCVRPCELAPTAITVSEMPISCQNLPRCFYQQGTPNPDMFSLWDFVLTRFCEQNNLVFLRKGCLYCVVTLHPADLPQGHQCIDMIIHSGILPKLCANHDPFAAMRVGEAANPGPSDLTLNFAITQSNLYLFQATAI